MAGSFEKFEDQDFIKCTESCEIHPNNCKSWRKKCNQKEHTTYKEFNDA